MKSFAPFLQLTHKAFVMRKRVCFCPYIFLTTSPWTCHRSVLWSTKTEWGWLGSIHCVFDIIRENRC